MAKKKERLDKLTFKELKDKAQGIEGFKSMNRFEIITALKAAAGEALCPGLAGLNPRALKAQKAVLEARLAETTDKKGRAFLRGQITRLQRATRVRF